MPDGGVSGVQGLQRSNSAPPASQSMRMEMPAQTESTPRMGGDGKPTNSSIFSGAAENAAKLFHKAGDAFHSLADKMTGGSSPASTGAANQPDTTNTASGPDHEPATPAANDTPTKPTTTPGKASQSSGDAGGNGSDNTGNTEPKTPTIPPTLVSSSRGGDGDNNGNNGNNDDKVKDKPKDTEDMLKQMKAQTEKQNLEQFKFQMESAELQHSNAMAITKFQSARNEQNRIAEALTDHASDAMTRGKNAQQKLSQSAGA